jgi:hypothetical protein
MIPGWLPHWRGAPPEIRLAAAPGSGSAIVIMIRIPIYTKSCFSKHQCAINTHAKGRIVNTAALLFNGGIKKRAAATAKSAKRGQKKGLFAMQTLARDR